MASRHEFDGALLLSTMAAQRRMHAERNRRGSPDCGAPRRLRAPGAAIVVSLPSPVISTIGPGTEVTSTVSGVRVFAIISAAAWVDKSATVVSFNNAAAVAAHCAQGFQKFHARRIADGPKQCCGPSGRRHAPPTHTTRNGQTTPLIATALRHDAS